MLSERRSFYEIFICLCGQNTWREPLTLDIFWALKKRKEKKQKEKKIKTRNKYLSTFVCWRDKTMPLKSENQFCCLKNIDSAREVMANIQAYEKRDWGIDVLFSLEPRGEIIFFFFLCWGIVRLWQYRSINKD